MEKEYLEQHSFIRKKMSFYFDFKCLFTQDKTWRKVQPVQNIFERTCPLAFQI